MEKREETIIKATLAILAIVVVFLILRRASSNGGVGYAIESGGVQGGDIIVDVTNPAAQGPSPSDYFNSVNNVNVNTIGINELSKKYVPLFGLVGMTAIGSINLTVNMPPEPVMEFMAPPVPVAAAAKAPAFVNQTAYRQSKFMSPNNPNKKIIQDSANYYINNPSTSMAAISYYNQGGKPGF